MLTEGQAQAYADLLLASRSDWTAVDCEMPASYAVLAPNSFHCALAAQIEQWAVLEVPFRFFFQHKDPGMRLRFCPQSRWPRFEDRLRTWLDLQQADGRLKAYYFRTYEPEIRRFGGAEGISLAHDVFAQDSRRVLRYFSMAAQNRTELSREAFSLALCAHLVRSALDAAESYDTWTRVSASLAEGAASHEPTCGTVDFTRELDKATPDEAALLEEARRDSQKTGARLQELVRTHPLFRPRAWLSAVCLFHWNRMGFNQTEILAITELLAKLSNPDLTSRG